MAYWASVFCFFVLGVAACVGDDPVGSDDALDAGASSSGAPSGSSSGTIEAGASDAGAGGCDLLADFQAPAAGPFVSLNTSDRAESGAWLSTDELVVYFSADGGGGPFSADLYRASRTDRSQPFTNPIRLPNPPNDLDAGVAHLDLAPIVGPGELIMYFTSDRLGTFDIWRSARQTAQLDWSSPERLLSTDGGVESPNSLYGNDLWYATNPQDDAGAAGIFSVTLTNGVPGAPVAHPELGAGYGAVLSDSGGTIYFSRAVGADVGQIFVATRTQAQGVFSNVAELPNVNSAVSDYPTWLSPDGCRLYVTSARDAGQGSLYVAERPPKR